QQTSLRKIRNPRNRSSEIANYQLQMLFFSKLLVIEVKKSDTRIPKKDDRDKIVGYLEQLKYRTGLLLTIDVTHTRRRRHRMDYYIRDAVTNEAIPRYTLKFAKVFLPVDAGVCDSPPRMK
ncbi:MAG: hypothetical protein WBP29_14575, partial [Candidatus Zixiibacteriota bacterium]